MIGIWTVNVILAAASGGVLILLLGLHVRTYRKVATTFGLSLMVFIALLLAHNLFSIYANLSLQAQGYRSNVALPMLVLNASELAAYLVLLRITWE
jgi:uncharacterized protein with PQ loop repeat